MGDEGISLGGQGRCPLDDRCDGATEGMGPIALRESDQANDALDRAAAQFGREPTTRSGRRPRHRIREAPGPAGKRPDDVQLFKHARGWGDLGPRADD